MIARAEVRSIGLREQVERLVQWIMADVREDRLIYSLLSRNDLEDEQTAFNLCTLRGDCIARHAAS